MNYRLHTFLFVSLFVCVAFARRDKNIRYRDKSNYSQTKSFIILFIGLSTLSAIAADDRFEDNYRENCVLSYPGAMAGRMLASSIPGSDYGDFRDVFDFYTSADGSRAVQTVSLEARKKIRHGLNSPYTSILSPLVSRTIN